MIYGDSPTFEKMIAEIKIFVNKTNQLDWVMKNIYQFQKKQFPYDP